MRKRHSPYAPGGWIRRIVFGIAAFLGTCFFIGLLPEAKFLYEIPKFVLGAVIILVLEAYVRQR